MIPLGVLAGSRQVSGGGGVSVVDTFTDTESLTLTSHTADTGQVWATNSTGDWTFHNASELVAPSGANVHAWIEYGAPDMAVSTRLIYTGSESAQAGVMARYDPTAGTGYVAQVDTGTIYLYKFDGTDLTLITSAVMHIAHPTDIALSVNGTKLTVTVNDGTVTSTDTTYSNGDYGGLFQRTSRTANRYDDFTIAAPRF